MKYFILLSVLLAGCATNNDFELYLEAQKSIEKQTKPKPKVEFEEGESVRVKEGSFANFNGTIEQINPDRGKMRVLVTIFGRPTPVELEYWQVEKI